MGKAFSMADCAAAPALFYANTLTPFAGTYDNLSSYLGRLIARPSFARSRGGGAVLRAVSDAAEAADPRRRRRGGA